MALSASFRSLLCFLLLGAGFGLCAQSYTYTVTFYDAERGLPSELTKCITKDSLGFIWIGSDEGLARFDGMRFYAYRKELSSPLVKKFMHTRSGRMLVITDMGIDQIEAHADTAIITPYIRGWHQQMTDSTLYYPKAAFEASDGHLWVSENMQVVKCKNGEVVKRYPFPKEDVTSSFIRSFTFTEDERGVLWVLSNPGRLFYYAPQLDRFVHVPWSMPIKNITSLLYKGKEDLLVGSYDGLFHVKLGWDEATVTPLIANLSFTSLAQDSSHIIYAGTRNSGIFRISNETGSYEAEQVREVAEGNISDVLFDAELDAWWICTQEGVGLVQRHFFYTAELDGKKTHIQGITATADSTVYVADGRGVYRMEYSQTGWRAKRVWDYDGNYVMTLSSAGNILLMGMSSGMLYRLNPQTGHLLKMPFGNEENLNAFVTSIFNDAQNRVWLTKRNTEGIYRIDEQPYSAGYKVNHYDRPEGLNTEAVILKAAPNGELYCAGRGDSTYLYRYDPESDEFVNISRPVAIECSERFAVEDMAFAGDTALWLATSCGVWFFDLHRNELPERVSFQSVAEELGVPYIGESVKAIGVDYSKHFWLASKLGIAYYTGSRLLFFDEASGLPAKTVTPRTIFIDLHHRLWIGTVKGAAVLPLPDMATQPTPQPVFLELACNGIPIGYRQLSEPPTFNSNSYLYLRYASLVFPGEEVHYQTRLLGPDSDSVWSYPVRKVEMLIPQLQPGDYVFQVRAQHLNGYHWSTPASFSFSVSPPWYRQWWALLLYGALAYGIIWLIVRWNTWRLVKAKRRLAQAVRERMAESIEQNKMLSQQKEEIEQQRDLISERNQMLEEAHRMIESKNDLLTEANHLLEEKVEERTQALNQALLEVKKSHKALDSFTYRSAHDLKGPIARILGIVNTLRYDARYMEEEWLQHFKQTAEEMDSMLVRLIGTLQIKAKAPAVAPIQLHGLCSEIIALFCADNRLQPSQVDIQIPKELLVNSDEELLARMLHNLLKNSIDFAQPHQRLHIWLSASESQDGVALQISDNGQGIDRSVQHRIFELFFRGNESSKGAGLGLYEVAIIAEKLRARVALQESKHGMGSTFLVTLTRITQDSVSGQYNIANLSYDE